MSDKMPLLQKIARKYSRRARAKRGKVFLTYLNPLEKDKILDLGGGDGSHLAGLLPSHTNVCVADIDQEALDVARHCFNFQTFKLTEDGGLPFSNKYFDIVFCSSAIEHVTGNKSQLEQYQDTRQFNHTAFQRQREFANEIRRVAKRYFVQTPNKYFLIESHTWMPFLIVLLPRLWQIRIIGILNMWWPKKTSPDWHLLTVEQVRELFPDAEIVLERSFGFTKSIMAIRR